MFGLVPTSPRLRVMAHNSLDNKPFEKGYHSFVGETACEYRARCYIRRYLWGELSFWIRDYTTIKKILENFGSVHQLLQ